MWLGPWHVKDGSTEVTKRTIAVSPTTQFVDGKRPAATKITVTVTEGG